MMKVFVRHLLTVIQAILVPFGGAISHLAPSLSLRYNDSLHLIPQPLLSRHR